MTLLPEGGAAIPVSVTTTRMVQGGAAIPVYGYMTAPTDGRPAMGGPALPVRVLTAADLKENGGQWTLEGRPMAMPVYTAPAGAVVQGGPALAVYPVNAWPTVPVTPPVWAPTDIAGLQLWLKADVGLYKDAAKAQPCTADADAVYTWADQSGNGRDAVQATAGARPLYKVNIQNGKPVVRFDGSDDWLRAIWTQPQPVQVFVVFTTSTAGKAIVDDGDGTDATMLLYFSLANQLNFFYSGTSLPVAATLNTWYVSTFVSETIGGTCKLVINNGTPATGGGRISAANGIALGARGNGTNPGADDIAEVVYFNRALTAGEETNMWNYLNTRWAVY